MTPEEDFRMRERIKQICYKRMLFIDIIAEKWPWEGDRTWEWWKAREGAEGWDTIVRKFTFWVIIYGIDWLTAKSRDWLWAYLWFGRLMTLGAGSTN